MKELEQAIITAMHDCNDSVEQDITILDILDTLMVVTSKFVHASPTKNAQAVNLSYASAALVAQYAELDGDFALNANGIEAARGSDQGCALGL